MSKMSEVKSIEGFTSFFRNLPVGKKLAAGFGGVLLILVLLVTFIEFKLVAQDTLQNQVIELRFPTNIAGHDLVNGINSSLAALRGYMILGKDSFKEQRKKAWQEIDDNLSIMTKMSESWTVPKNIQALADLKQVMAEFKNAQQQVEEISHSPDEQPAMKILLTQAAPRASQVVKAITGMINEEKKQEATPQRKALLATFADSRGSFAMGLASIRGYLISGEQKWADDFNNRWAVNNARFATIKKNSHLLTSAQRKHFKIYADMRTEFAPFPPQMFEIRGSNKWNMANYLLGTEAAPRAGKALKILSGMVENQNQLVANDALLLQEQSTSLKVVSIIAAIIALIIGSLVALFITRMIVASLTEAITASKRIANGDLSGHITINSQDEMGQLLQEMKQMQNKLTQVIEKDVQGIVDTAKQGDLTQRISLDDKSGFYEKLSRGINELVNVNEQVVDDTVRMFSAMASGDLSQRVTNQYHGAFNTLKQDANQTAEKLTQVIEGDIQALIESAKNGDLSKRIDMDDKQGFFASLSSGINELVGINEQVINDTVCMFGALSLGDLSPRITNSYLGAFDVLKHDANQTVEKLTQVIEKDIQQIIDSAKNGDLTQRISLDDKDGFFNTLSSGINELVDVNERVINDTVRIMGAMAEGDLTHTIDHEYLGTFGKLKGDTNNTIQKLTGIISSISSSADLVDSASNELAMGNDDLSMRTEQQAASLEETASSMEELACTVKQNADSAENVNMLANKAQQFAIQGGDVVNDAIKSMAEINKASREIVNITNVIDEIAFQTNLLALNAAVEAARAGEQGRGFAVVAAEVRNLAQRSASSAKEIKTLIANSVEKVNYGTQLVNESGENLAEIVGSVKKVCDIISDIASSAREQTAGIDQVNVAISQMDEMTQQNAALVEEATAASRAVADQAKEMNDEMRFFSLNKKTLEKLRATATPTADIKTYVTPKKTVITPRKSESSKAVDSEWEEF